MNYKEISKINKEIDRRYSQINNIEEQIKYLKEQLEKTKYEYEIKYIKTAIGQLIKYHNWLVEEIDFLNEDKLYI